MCVCVWVSERGQADRLTDQEGYSKIVLCTPGLSIFPLELCQMWRRPFFIFSSPECYFFSFFNVSLSLTLSVCLSFFVLVKLFYFLPSTPVLAEKTSVVKRPSWRWLFFRSAFTDFVVNLPAKLLKWKLQRIVYSFDSPQDQNLGSCFTTHSAHNMGVFQHKNILLVCVHDSKTWKE